MDEYLVQNPDFSSRIDAAFERDNDWKRSVENSVKANFGVSSDLLEGKVEEIEPLRLLQRARNSLRKIDVSSSGLLADTSCRELIKEISQMTFTMKKKIERHERSIN